MPVKNKNRQSNSGYEGVITGLNDEEKKVLEDAGIGGSVFDITPYLTSNTSISVEGYNAVREFVTSNKGGIVKLNMGEYIMYTTCFSVSSDSLTFHYYFVFDSGIYDTTFAEILINSKGNVTFNDLPLYQVLANPADSATETLSKIRIGNDVYNVVDEAKVQELIDSSIGNINSILDNINGEVI